MIDFVNNFAREVITEPTDRWVSATYLNYSIYTIKERGLVPIDGLKPVNRRVLYSHFQKEGKDAFEDTVKAATVVGSAMGWHPHGDASIADAMARMAQVFNMRVPLLSAQGSPGHFPGDKPAEPRYWEAQLTPACRELLRELPEGSVEIGRNFDNKLDEARILPVRWPVYLVNGSFGIVVGYSSSMPPNNPNEVMDALIAMARNPDITLDEVLTIIKGPDLPMGCEIIGTDGIRSYYETGKGTITVRARYTIEHLNRGAVSIRFNELPPETNGAKIKEEIRKKKDKGKFADIRFYDDQSDLNGFSFVVETKAGTNHLAVIAELYKETGFQSKVSYKTLILDSNYKPVVSNLMDMMRDFLNFRVTCNVNKAKTRGEKLEKRKLELEAITKVLVDIDRTIEVIRDSDTAKEARETLMDEFGLDESQANYILAMRLRSLTKADSLAVKNELETISAELDYLNTLLNDPKVMMEHLVSELEATKEVIGDERRTVIVKQTEAELRAEERQVAKKIRASEKKVKNTVYLFSDGTITRHVEGEPAEPYTSKLEFKPGAKAVLVTADGNGHRVPLSYITENERVTVDSIIPGQKVVGLFLDSTPRGHYGGFMLSAQGKVKVTKTNFPPSKDTFPVFKLTEGDYLVSAQWVGTKSSSLKVVAVASTGKATSYPLETIRQSGASAGGSNGFNVGKGEAIAGMVVPMDSPGYIVATTANSFKVTSLDEVPVAGKGSAGLLTQRLTKTDGDTLLTATVTSKPMGLISGALESLEERATGRGERGTLKPAGFIAGNMDTLVADETSEESGEPEESAEN